VRPFIEVHGLHHVYPLDGGGRVVALQDVNLTVDQGEFLAIVGPNGSGKSTLARHLNGLLLPTAGEVWVDGLLTSDATNLTVLRQRVGMVFQNPDNQLVASTVEEDVAFGPENQALPADEIRRRVDDALDIVGLAGYATHPPQMLSGGQRQRVAIAGALASRPACIVFDEPTSMLDPLGRHQILETIRHLNADQGITVVLITQSMDEAAVAQRLLVMDAGQVVMRGSPEDVFEHREWLESLGLGLPSAVEIAHRLRDQGFAIQPGLLTVQELARALC
jgi:energy-coupling factor transport system ATP-binding protein